MKAGAATVYVVDDDASVRKGLARLLRSHGLGVETFADPREFLKVRLREGPACLVLDVMMPELGGLEVQDELNAMSSRIPIVFITGHGTIPTSVQALKQGAVDFIEKPFEDEILLASIREGFRRHSAILTYDLEHGEAQQRFSRLTPRERDVMELVVKGLPNKQIADLLDIAEKTVKVHRSRVMTKMEAGSLAELVRMAERSDLR
jgi:FixJ family two-component response regulator